MPNATEAIFSYRFGGPTSASSVYVDVTLSDGAVFSITLDTVDTTARILYLWDVPNTSNLSIVDQFKRPGGKFAETTLETVAGGFALGGYMTPSLPNWVGLTEIYTYSSNFHWSAADADTDGNPLLVSAGDKYNMNSVWQAISFNKQPGTGRKLIALVITWRSFAGHEGYSLTAEGEPFSFISATVASQGRLSWWQVTPTFLPENAPVVPFNYRGSRLLDFHKVA